MQKTSVQLCKTCVYSRTSSASIIMTCDYLLITGKRRGCRLGECYKYEKSEIKRLPKALRGE